MTTTTETNVDHPGLPRVHQGHAPGDLGRDHEARVDRAVRLRRPGGVRPAPGRRDLPRSRERRDGGRWARRRWPSTARSSRSDPPHKLVQTWRMLMDDAMAAEGFTRLTYEIDEGKGGVSKLTRDPRARGRAATGAAALRRSGGQGRRRWLEPGSSATSRRCSRPARRWTRTTSSTKDDPTRWRPRRRGLHRRRRTDADDLPGVHRQHRGEDGQGHLRHAEVAHGQVRAMSDPIGWTEQVLRALGMPQDEIRRSSRHVTPRSFADTSSCIESDCRSNSTTRCGRSARSRPSSCDQAMTHISLNGAVTCHVVGRPLGKVAMSPTPSPRRLRPRSRSSQTLRGPGTPLGLRTSTEPARRPPGIASDPPARRRRRRAHARRCPAPPDPLPIRRYRRSIRTRPDLAASSPPLGCRFRTGASC